MLFKLIAVASILLSYGTLVQAQDTTWLDTIISESGSLLSAIVPTLAVLSFVLFVWGAIVFITTVADDTAREAGKKKMFWGLVALFVFLSVWGIVQLLQAVFGVGTPPPATPPKAILPS